MITGTIFLIMSIFGGGPNFFTIPKAEMKIFTIHKLENQLGDHIADKNREKEALQLFKQAKNEIKALEKRLKASGKEFKKLQKDRTIQREELEQIFAASEKSRKAVQTVLVEKRLKLRQLLTEEEWANLMEGGIASIEENPDKRNKEIKKIEKSDNKLLGKVEKSINKQIVEEDQRSKAMDAYASFENKVRTFSDESIGYLTINDEAAQQYHTDQVALEKVFAGLNSSRAEAMFEFLQLRDELINLSSDKDWKKLSKTLNGLL